MEEITKEIYGKRHFLWRDIRIKINTNIVYFMVLFKNQISSQRF